MTAELLRKAAATLRMRADIATDGPWRVSAEGSEGSRIAPASGTKREQARFIANINGRIQPQDGSNAAYIAMMHPGVGLALADWLEDAALRRQYTPTPPDRALAIARLIVGEQ